MDRVPPRVLLVLGRRWHIIRGAACPILVQVITTLFTVPFIPHSLCFPRYMIGPDGEENIPHREWLMTYDRIVKEVKVELANRGRADDFIGSKVNSQNNALAYALTSGAGHLQCIAKCHSRRARMVSRGLHCT